MWYVISDFLFDRQSQFFLDISQVFKIDFSKIETLDVNQQLYVQRQGNGVLFWSSLTP